MPAAALNPLTAFYPEIRSRIAELAGACAWPGLEEQIARHLTRTHLPLHLILPIASAAAVGGEPRRALSAAAACAFLIVSMRWFDDLQDRDRGESLWQEVGPARATNMAAAALTVAWRALADDPEPSPAALRAFGELTVELARGQDADLQAGTVRRIEDYWDIMRGKTGAALALGCRVGALAACPANEAAAATCARCGSHLGVAMQILDDLDGVFHPDGSGDLASGKVTLPVLYGLASSHPAQQELAAIVAAGRLATAESRVREILESIAVRELLVLSAHEEHRRALGFLAQLPPPATPMARAGREALEAFGDALLVGWEDLLERGTPC